jgi:hypothetical protein|tara:strand:- start:1963 stop:2397 length:435 start_codon:yes stop_codon:yes gene_type:complete
MDDNTNPTNTPTPEAIPFGELAKKLGISTTQISKKSTTVRKSKGNQPKLDVAREDIKSSVATCNSKHGKLIKSDTYVKDGKMKDANGKVKLDDKGEVMWNYKHLKLDGFFIIDERADGLFDVSHIMWYSETFQVGDYTEVKTSK